MFGGSQNITWDYVDTAYWSTIEVHIGIICACLPSLRTLFIALGAKVLGSTVGNSKPSFSRSAGGSKTATLVEKGQETPKHGDEGDFIPLVDVEIAAGKADDESIRKIGPNHIRATTSIITSSDSEECLRHSYHHRPHNGI